MRPLLVIVGPTGAGKTELACRVARHVGGEVVSADSQQVYRGMDIGTGKASAAEQEEVPHHLLDVLEPDEEMTAARYVELADEAITAIRAKDAPVIICGGTMLYVRALLRGLFEGPAADASIRQELSQRAEEQGVASLWSELQQVDPVSAERINDTDLRRITRALEVHRLSGVALSEHHRRHQLQPARYAAKLVGIQPERSDLYERINARVVRMMEQGLEAEVSGLRERGFGSQLRSQQAIGYRELHSMFDGDLERAEAMELIQRNSRRYARRQQSWYRGDDSVRWWDDSSMVDLADLERYLVGQIHD